MLATFWYKGTLSTTDGVVGGGSAQEEKLRCKLWARVFCGPLDFGVPSGFLVLDLRLLFPLPLLFLIALSMVSVPLCFP